MIEVVEIGGVRHVRVNEDVGGGRGADYFYIERGDRLIHLAKVFGGFRKKLIESRKGHRVLYEYLIPCNELRKIGDYVVIRHFSFSNKGNFSASKYVIDTRDCSMVREENASLDDVALICRGTGRVIGAVQGSVKLEVDPNVCCLVDVYGQYVPSFIKVVKEVEERHGFKLLFITNEAKRLENVYTNPSNAWKVAITYTRGRAMALRNYVQMAHELYILALVAEALGGRSRSSTWDLGRGQDYPTAIIDLDGESFIVWYQFSIKPWVNVVREGFMRRDRQYVMPDLVIFKGRNDVEGGFKEGSFSKIAVIDVKIKLGDEDVRQLLAYKNVFDNAFKCPIKYMVALLSAKPLCPGLGIDVREDARRVLERNGFDVIDDVAPGREGERVFMEEVKRFLLS